MVEADAECDKTNSVAQQGGPVFEAAKAVG